MIVNPLVNGWEIIFQRNHALIAGAIANEVAPKYRPPHWIETLSAIIEHDDGQAGWHEGKHISDMGRPLDFTMYKFDLDQAKRVVKEAYYKSQWITLLVSMHTSALYSSIKDKPAELKKFLKEQDQLQAKLQAAFSLEREQMERYYGFLRWCDECSLILCKNRLSFEALKIGSLTSKDTNFIQLTGPQEACVTPWCFTLDSFSVSAEVYTIHKKKFNTTDELKDSIKATQPVTRIWKFRSS